MKKLNDISIGIIMLGYIIMIGDMIMNNNRYIYKFEYMFFINIILLCIGFYSFIKLNKNELEK